MNSLSSHDLSAHLLLNQRNKELRITVLMDYMRELVEKYKLTEENICQEISDAHLADISQSCCEKWRLLPGYLAMKAISVPDIERDHKTEEERRLAFFTLWKHRKGAAATYQALITALLKSDYRQDAEAVCKILKGLPFPVPQESTKLTDTEDFTSATNKPATTAKASAATVTTPALTHPNVRNFLKKLTPAETRAVGLELGLHHPHLKRMSDESLLDEMIHCWLREDDIVHETSGTPSWESLAKALEEAGFNGVAANIRKECAKAAHAPDTPLTPDADTLKNLEQQLERDLLQITRRFTSFSSAIRKHLKEKGVTASELCAHLMSMSAFNSDDSNEKPVLLSEASEELERADTVDKIFIILNKKYVSFLNYEVFQALLDEYGTNDRIEELDYPTNLQDYVNRHNIKEFADINPLIKTFTDTSKQVVLKIDIESTCRLAKLKDLTKTLSNIIGLRAAALRIIDVKEGCVELTLLMPAHLADFIFTSDEIFTPDQIQKFKALSVEWLKCNGHTFNFMEAQDITDRETGTAPTVTHRETRVLPTMCIESQEGESETDSYYTARDYFSDIDEPSTIDYFHKSDGTTTDPDNSASDSDNYVKSVAKFDPEQSSPEPQESERSFSEALNMLNSMSKRESNASMNLFVPSPAMSQIIRERHAGSTGETSTTDDNAGDTPSPTPERTEATIAGGESTKHESTEITIASADSNSGPTLNTPTEVSRRDASTEAQEVVADRKLTVMLAGKSAAGKSTLIKNVFGLGKDPAPEPEIITVTKYGTTIKIIDTASFTDKKYLQQLSKRFKKEVDLFLYCLPIKPDAIFDDFNPAIMRSLQDAFGKDIWRHCMVVLTFSNQAWVNATLLYEDDSEAAINQYTKYIEAYIVKFKDELKKLRADAKLIVKTVFELQPDRDQDANPHNQIIAIPAGFKHNDPVIPGVQYDFAKGSSAPPQYEIALRTSENDWAAILLHYILQWGKPVRI